MNDSSHHRQESDHKGVHESQRPYWKRAHRDWRVWLGVVLMLGAMLIYLMTGDLAWRPRANRSSRFQAPSGNSSYSAEVHK